MQYKFWKDSLSCSSKNDTSWYKHQPSFQHLLFDFQLLELWGFLTRLKSVLVYKYWRFSCCCYNKPAFPTCIKSTIWESGVTPWEQVLRIVIINIVLNKTEVCSIMNIITAVRKARCKWHGSGMSCEVRIDDHLLSAMSCFIVLNLVSWLCWKLCQPFVFIAAHFEASSHRPLLVI